MNSASSDLHRRRRRQRTIGTVIATAAVAYGTYRLVRWYLGDEDDKEEELEPIADDSIFNAFFRRTQPSPPHTNPRYRQIRATRMLQCRQQVSTTFPEFTAHIKRIIDRHTDISDETKLLKQSRRNSSDTQSMQQDDAAHSWTAIKIKTMTGIIATMYAHSLLFVSLSVATHLLGGHALRSQMHASSEPLESDNDIPHAILFSVSLSGTHQFVLEHVLRYFFQEHDGGLHRLVLAVQQSVTTCLQDWNVLDPVYLRVSPMQLTQAMERLYIMVAGSEPGGLPSFLLDSNTTAESPAGNTASGEGHLIDGVDAGTDNGAQSVLNETWDVLESPLCSDALRECVCTCQRQVVQELFGPGAVTLPLATVLTKLRKLTKTFYCGTVGNGINHLIAMERLPLVVELSDVSFN
jgi:hypothetical protein